MTLPAPIANGISSNVVTLSQLRGPLKISIPDSADFSPMDDVFAILGENEENPDWAGAKVQAGQWNEEIEDVERAPNLSVEVPKKVLEKYLNQTITLRYQASGESGLTASSAVLALRIEA
jgi:hypothetical protein